MMMTDANLRPSGPIPSFNASLELRFKNGIGVIRAGGVDLFRCDGREFDVPIRRYSNVRVGRDGVATVEESGSRTWFLVLMRPNASSREDVDQVVPICQFRHSARKPDLLEKFCTAASLRWYGHTSAVFADEASLRVILAEKLLTFSTDQG